MAWPARRLRAGPQSQPAGTSASAELARDRTGSACPFSSTVPEGRLVRAAGGTAWPAEERGGWVRVGADAGLMATTESIAAASIDSATQVAISGRIAACPPNSRLRSGLKRRNRRSRRRRARCSRWYASTSRSSSRASSGITMFTGGGLPSSRPGSLGKLTGTSSAAAARLRTLTFPVWSSDDTAADRWGPISRADEDHQVEWRPTVNADEAGRGHGGQHSGRSSAVAARVPGWHRCLLSVLPYARIWL